MYDEQRASSRAAGQSYIFPLYLDQQTKGRKRLCMFMVPLASSDCRYRTSLGSRDALGIVGLGFDSNLKWFSKGQYLVWFWIEYSYQIEYFIHTVIVYVYVDTNSAVNAVNPVKWEERYVTQRTKYSIPIVWNIFQMTTGRVLKIFDLNSKRFRKQKHSKNAKIFKFQIEYFFESYGTSKTHTAGLSVIVTPVGSCISEPFSTGAGPSLS